MLTLLEKNKRIVRRYFDEVLNQRDLTVIDASFAPDFVSHLNTEDVGLDIYTQAIKRYHLVFPDLHVTIEAQIAEGDMVATRWKARGTQQGPFGSIPPTGKEVTVTAMHFHRLADGKIVEHWEQFDLMGMLQQLGALSQRNALA